MVNYSIFVVILYTTLNSYTMIIFDVYSYDSILIFFQYLLFDLTLLYQRIFLQWYTLERSNMLSIEEAFVFFTWRYTYSKPQEENC